MDVWGQLESWIPANSLGIWVGNKAEFALT